MKTVCFIFLLFLCSCTSLNSADLSVRSDLKLVSNKSVYYDIKDSSVIAARINRIIRQRLKETGWTIYTNPKSVDYSYSIITDEKEYIHSYIGNIWGATYLMQQWESFPFVFFIIQNTKTKENVYEAKIILNSNYEFGALEEFTKVATPALFSKEDKKWNIECITVYLENGERHDCTLKNPDE